MKICNKCKTEKEFVKFTKDKKKKDGLNIYCIDCVKEIRIKNKEKLKNYDKEYRRLNIEKRKEYEKKYRKDNNKKISEYDLCYRYINKDRKRENNKIYHKKMMATNSLYRMKSKIRALIQGSIKKQKYTKSSKTYEIIGCSFEDFRIHIENQFEAWMNWNNNGNYTGKYSETWQYDHIIPISSGMTEDEIIKLNHYTNFRPLCSRENLEKSNKKIHSI